MEISKEFKVVVAFFCVCLIYHIDGLPQPQYGWHHHHHNSTAWHNSGRHNATHQRPNNWQSHHRPNQTIDHQNHTNPNNWHPHHRPGRPWHNNHHSHRRNWPQNISISSQPISNDGGGQFPPITSGWVAPSNSANSTNWKSGVSNINANRGFQPQVNNGSNSDPIWHLGSVAIGSNLGPQLAPLAGSAKNATNTGWNIPSGQLN